jgi:hypothetical protein
MGHYWLIIKKAMFFQPHMLKNIAFLMPNMAVVTTNYEQLRITANYGYFLLNCVSKRYFSDWFAKKSLRDRATTANSH